MDRDLFDALLLDADFAFLETAFSTAETSQDDSPGATAGPALVQPPPPPPAVGQQSPAAQQLSPVSHRRASCGPGSGAGAQVADKAQSNAHSEPKVHYLPPCRVCNGQASGLHYGVNTCEACKGFFHRSLHRHSPYICSKGGQCVISHVNGSICSACRYQRCLEVGMTKDAVKTGRYSHAKRTQDTLEVKRLQSEQGENLHGSTCPTVTDCVPKGVQELCGRTGWGTDKSSHSTIECLTSAFEQSFAEASLFYREPKKIEVLIRDTLLRYDAASVDFVMFGDPEDRKHLLEMRDEVFHVQQLVSTHDASSCEGTLPGLQTVSMLKYYIEKLELIIRSIVSFAKVIPGFMSLELHDQIVLIKAGRAEVIPLLKHKQLDMKRSCSIEYARDKDVVNLVPLSVMRHVWVDDEFHRQCWCNARRLQQLDLSVSDVALLTAIVVASPDREQLLEPARVQAIQETLVAALRRNIVAHRCRGDLPAADRFLATLLLQLPVLRTFNQLNEVFVVSVQQRYPFGLPPLVQECLSTKQPDDVQC